MSIGRRNRLPQLVPARVRKLAADVEAMVWSPGFPVDVQRTDEQADFITVADAEKLPLSPLQPGESFGRGGNHWTSFWMRIEIPPEANSDAGDRFLRWKCQGETTVWLDGIPWAGLDLAHNECPLPNHACTLWLECCSWQTGVWITMEGNAEIDRHGLRFESAEIVMRDQDAWQCRVDLDVIVQTMDEALASETDLKLAPRVGYCRALESVSPRLRLLLHQLDALCDQWLMAPDLSRLAESTQQLIGRWPAESWQPTMALCGHAHIDLVWLWPEAATRRKVVHTVATVMRLMERYPEMTFVQSMPALYRMLESSSPELMDSVTTLIELGRWEVLGGFEVEPDTNLPGGEALVRSALLGQAKIAELTGRPSEIAWIPDVFGYSQSLPQILAQVGIRYFFTTKMAWSNVTKFPYTSFVWRGADGTEVLAHLGTADYTGEVLLEPMNRAFREHRQADVHPEILGPTGYGDGGGGPTEMQIERARRFANLSGAPRVRWTRADAFFQRLETCRDTLPIYQGELYLEFHRGTYTTQSEFKRLYRLAEQGLQAHEAARVALHKPPLTDERWQRVAFAHFHDAIPAAPYGRSMMT